MSLYSYTKIRYFIIRDCQSGGSRQLTCQTFAHTSPSIYSSSLIKGTSLSWYLTVTIFMTSNDFGSIWYNFEVPSLPKRTFPSVARPQPSRILWVKLLRLVKLCRSYINPSFFNQVTWNNLSPRRVRPSPNIYPSISWWTRTFPVGSSTFRTEDLW